MGYDLRLDTGSYVLTHARAFQQHPDFELVGGVDPVPERSAAFEAQYTAPSFADVADAVVRTSPDVVAVATPTPVHAETLRRAVECSETTAILCEKPLAYDFG